MKKILYVLSLFLLFTINVFAKDVQTNQLKLLEYISEDNAITVVADIPKGVGHVYWYVDDTYKGNSLSYSVAFGNLESNTTYKITAKYFINDSQHENSFNLSTQQKGLFDYDEALMSDRIVGLANLTIDNNMEIVAVDHQATLYQDIIYFVVVVDGMEYEVIEPSKGFESAVFSNLSKGTEYEYYIVSIKKDGSFIYSQKATFKF